MSELPWSENRRSLRRTHRNTALPNQRFTADWSREDVAAVDAYSRIASGGRENGSIPTEEIDAFAALSPAQTDLLFARSGMTTPRGHSDDAEPASGRRAKARHRGILARWFPLDLSATGWNDLQIAALLGLAAPPVFVHLGLLGWRAAESEPEPRRESNTWAWGTR